MLENYRLFVTGFGLFFVTALLLFSIPQMVIAQQGPPEQAKGTPGPPEGVGPPDEIGTDKTLPEQAKAPEDRGKPEGVPGGGFGGIVATEDIVGIEELSTLNVGDVKNAGMKIGPRALGTPLLEISSDSVCGDSICDAPMSIQEKIQMYLASRGLTVPER